VLRISTVGFDLLLSGHRGDLSLRCRI
jgi:hypothetical protein